MKHACLALLLGAGASLLAPAGVDNHAAQASPRTTRAGHSTSSRASGFYARGMTATSIFPSAAVSYDSGGYGARSVAVADVNGDGNPDLIVADRCQTADSGCKSNTGGEVGVLLGNGDGTFQTAVIYPTGAFEGRGVAVGDFNGDGKPDIAVASFCLSSTDCSSSSPGAVSILLGNGDGTFKTATVNGSGGASAFNVVAADLDGDGKPDLAVVNRCTLSNCTSSIGTGVVGVLLNKGDGTFQTAVPYNSTGYSGQAVAVGDVNGDGKPDLVEVDQCRVYGSCKDNSSPVSVFLGVRDGTFQSAQQYLTGGQPAYSVALGDLNGDGKLDIAVANQCVTPTTCTSTTNGGVAVLLNQGDGTFQDAVIYTASGTTTSWVDIGDVDGDGHPDVVAVNYCADPADSSCAAGSVDLMLGNGDGTLQVPQTYPAGGAGSYMASVADANGDGRLDLVIANECAGCNDGSVSVLLNVAFGVAAEQLNPQMVNLGQSATSTVTITAAEGFTDMVNLACSVTGVQSPPQTPAPTCSFDKSSISGGSGTATLTVTTVGQAQSAVRRKAFMNQSAAWLPVAAISLFGLCLGNFGARRRHLSGMGLLLIAALMLTSCGAGGSGGGGGGGGGGGCSSCTAVGNYNIGVTATDANNSKDTQSVFPLLTLNVQ